MNHTNDNNDFDFSSEDIKSAMEAIDQESKAVRDVAKRESLKKSNKELLLSFNNESYKDYKEAFSSRFKKLTQNIDKKDFCQKTGISEESYRTYLNGTTFPGIENLLTISEYFDCSIDYLLGKSVQNVFRIVNDIHDELFLSSEAINSLASITLKEKPYNYYHTPQIDTYGDFIDKILSYKHFNQLFDAFGKYVFDIVTFEIIMKTWDIISNTFNMLEKELDNQYHIDDNVDEFLKSIKIFKTDEQIKILENKFNNDKSGKTEWLKKRKYIYNLKCDLLNDLVTINYDIPQFFDPDMIEYTIKAIELKHQSKLEKEFLKFIDESLSGERTNLNNYIIIELIKILNKESEDIIIQKSDSCISLEEKDFQDEIKKRIIDVLD